MSTARYVVHEAGSLDEYQTYEHDLTAYGVPAGAVSFNVDWVPESQRDWLLRVLGDTFERVASTAHAAGLARVRRDVRNALDL